jgi:hypothetical protein
LIQTIHYRDRYDKDKSHKASLGNCTEEKLLFLPYTRKKSIWLIRKPTPIKEKVDARR